MVLLSLDDMFNKPLTGKTVLTWLLLLWVVSLLLVGGLVVYHLLSS